MNVPIVQGVAVPDGGNDVNAQYHQPNHDNAPYVASEGGGVGATYNTFADKPEQQPKEWKDTVWAIAFYAHLVVMISVIVSTGNLSAISAGDDGQGGDTNYDGLVWLVGLCAVASIGISSCCLSLMMKNAEFLVKASLIFSVAFSGLIGVLGLMSGNTLAGIFCLVMFAVGICYAYAVWPRIPFVAANLNTALTAVKSNMGLTVIAYVMLLLAFGWTLVWFVGAGSYLDSEHAMIVFCLLVSYYWVHQVLQNTVHVTTAGT